MVGTSPMREIFLESKSFPGVPYFSLFFTEKRTNLRAKEL